VLALCLQTGDTFLLAGYQTPIGEPFTGPFQTGLMDFDTRSQSLYRRLRRSQFNLHGVKTLAVFGMADLHRRQLQQLLAASQTDLQAFLPVRSGHPVEQPFARRGSLRAKGCSTG